MVRDGSSGAWVAVCHGPVAFNHVKLSSGEFLVKGKKVWFCTFSITIERSAPIAAYKHQESFMVRFSVDLNVFALHAIELEQNKLRHTAGK